MSTDNRPSSRILEATPTGGGQVAFARALRPWLLLAPVLTCVIVLFIVPLVGILRLSVIGPDGFTLQAYAEFFGDPFYLRILARTLWVALVVTFFCLLLGYPIAYAAARYGGTLGMALVLIVTMSFWTSLLARTYAWMVILGSQGLVANAARALGLDPPKILFTGFAANIGMIHILLPFMVLSLFAVMQRIDTNLLRASASLGATPFQTFRRVFVPLSVPGMINGCALVYIVCLGFYVTPELLGGPKDQMIARLVGSQIEQLLDWQEAATIATVLLGVTLFIFAVYDYFFGLDRLWRS